MKASGAWCVSQCDHASDVGVQSDQSINYVVGNSVLLGQSNMSVAVQGESQWLRDHLP
jgi:hypothetical protein